MAIFCSNFYTKVVFKEEVGIIRLNLTDGVVNDEKVNQCIPYVAGTGILRTISSPSLNFG